MSGGDDRQGAVWECEERTAEELESIRVIRDRWESYGREMRELDHGLDAAGVGEDPGNFFTQRRCEARRELGACVGVLVRDQAELLDGVDREVRSRGEEERDRLSLGVGVCCGGEVCGG